jgi:bifunctional DNase/RNase
MDDSKIKLRIKGLTNSQIQSGAYALILSDEESGRIIPIIVGTYEAQSIAIAIEGIKPPRPLTHDLLITLMKTTGYNFDEVFIYKFENGVFFSEIVLSDNYHEIRIDSRTSDAIAIALRANCPIFTTKTMIEKCGVDFEANNESIEHDTEQLSEEFTIDDMRDLSKLKKQLQKLQKKDIEDRMTKAIAEENYEFAKIYKDELIRREGDLK